MLVADRAHARRRQLFEEVFPDAAKQGRRPNHKDWDTLEQEFWHALESIVHDRNDNRAHPRYGWAPKSGTAKMLDLGDIEAHAAWADKFLNRLRVLVDSSSWGGLTPESEPKSLAADLVDILLFGGRRRMDLLSGLAEDAAAAEGLYAWQYRERAYERLWTERRSNALPFNHPDQLRPTEKDDESEDSES